MSVENLKIAVCGGGGVGTCDIVTTRTIILTNQQYITIQQQVNHV